MSGFATGSYAAALAALPREDAISAFVRQLAAVLPGAPTVKELQVGALCARTLGRTLGNRG